MNQDPNTPLSQDPDYGTSAEEAQQHTPESDAPAAAPAPALPPALPAPLELLIAAKDRIVERIKPLAQLYLIAFLVGVLMGLSFIAATVLGGPVGVLILTLLVLIMLVGMSVVQITSIILIGTDELLDLRTALRTALSKILSYWWLQALMGSIILGGLALFIVPGILLFTWFSVAVFILFFEGKKGMVALLTSREYVRGRTLGVLGRLFVLFLVAIIVAILTDLMTEAAQGVQPFVATIFAPIINTLFGLLALSYLFELYRGLKATTPALRDVSTVSRLPFIGLALFGIVATITVTGLAVWVLYTLEQTNPGLLRQLEGDPSFEIEDWMREHMDPEYLESIDEPTGLPTAALPGTLVENGPETTIHTLVREA